MKKERMDVLLVERALASTIDEARRFIMAGLAIADDKRIDKAGDLIPISAFIRLKNRLPYVSRGGLKLQKAIEFFNLSMRDSIVIDIGASTGGFTDVALKTEHQRSLLSIQALLSFITVYVVMIVLFLLKIQTFA